MVARQSLLLRSSCYSTMKYCFEVCNYLTKYLNTHQDVEPIKPINAILRHPKSKACGDINAKAREDECLTRPNQRQMLRCTRYLCMLLSVAPVYAS